MSFLSLMILALIATTGWADPVAQVVFFQGPGFYVLDHLGRERFLPGPENGSASEGALVLDVGDRIITLPNTQVEIAFLDETGALFLAGNTDLSLGDVQSGAAGTRVVSLRAGELWGLIPAGDRSLLVRGATVSVDARASEFAFLISRNNDGRVFETVSSVEGEVTLRSTDTETEPVIVPAGQQGISRVGENGRGAISKGSMAVSGNATTSPFRRPDADGPTRPPWWDGFMFAPRIHAAGGFFVGPGLDVFFARRRLRLGLDVGPTAASITAPAAALSVSWEPNTGFVSPGLGLRGYVAADDGTNIASVGLTFDLQIGPPDAGWRVILGNGLYAPLSSGSFTPLVYLPSVGVRL